MDFVLVPPGKVPEYVEEVHVSPSAWASEPFLHLLPDVLRLLPHRERALPLPVNASLWQLRSPATHSTPGGTGPRISRSIHCQIPRSVPRAVSSSITHLELGNVRFHLFAHVSHVLYELASLTRFRGSKLTWPRVDATFDTGVYWVRRWKTEQSLKNLC